MTESALPVRHPRRVFGDKERAAFRVFWYSTNILLIFSALIALYAADWEYSTQRYLKGFSDAIIPEAASPRENYLLFISLKVSAPPIRRSAIWIPLDSHSRTTSVRHRRALGNRLA